MANESADRRSKIQPDSETHGWRSVFLGRLLKFVYANQGVGRFTELGIPFPHFTVAASRAARVVGPVFRGRNHGEGEPSRGGRPVPAVAAVEMATKLRGVDGRAHGDFGVAVGLAKITSFSSRACFPNCRGGGAYYANKAPAALFFELYSHRVPVMSQSDVPTWRTALMKAGNFLVYCAVLLFFWKKNRRPTAMVYELVTFALVTILISPVSWRHHYLLTLIPVF